METNSAFNSILLSSQLVASISWQIDTKIQEALQNQPGPGGSPPNRQFGPDSARSQVLHCKFRKFSCHPGINLHPFPPKMTLLVAHHGLRTMFEPVPSAHVENPLSFLWIAPTSSGTWQALVPHRPWFLHWATSFSGEFCYIHSCRPVLQGSPLYRYSHTTYCQRDHGSCHPPRALSARNPCWHSLGPRTSLYLQVWRAFCHGSGATAGLSSGFHPQSNGQTEWANQDLETSLGSMDMPHYHQFNAVLSLMFTLCHFDICHFNEKSSGNTNTNKIYIYLN